MYEHVDKFSEKMEQCGQLLKKAEVLLDEIEKMQTEFEALDEYYRSEQWRKDFEDAEKNKIPESLKRGALSEDGLYNMFCDRHDLMLRMIETALKGLKSE